MKIDKFEIIDNECFVIDENGNYRTLSSISKVKQPIKLFTEEQMKECFHESTALENMGNCFRKKYATFEDYKEQKLNKQ